MLGLPWKLIGIALAALALVSAVALHFRGDARTRAERDGLLVWQSDVVDATREAADNPKLTPDGTAGQIIALGMSNDLLKASIDAQNQRIDELAADAVRLKARAADLKKIADKAEAQRQSALRRLSDMALEPGTRDDCMMLLREAETALDIVKEAGL